MATLDDWGAFLGGIGETAAEIMRAKAEADTPQLTAAVGNTQSEVQTTSTGVNPVTTPTAAAPINNNDVIQVGNTTINKTTALIVGGVLLALFLVLLIKK